MTPVHSKVCKKCGTEKPLAEFYRHKGMVDGYLNHCKTCVKERVSDHRNENLEAVRKKDKERASKRDSKLLTGRGRSYREINPDKYKAHTAVGNAVRDGRLVKPSTCERCGAGGRITGHHHSYAKEFRLDVEWLCHPCHAKEHKRLKDLGIDPDGKG